MSRWLIGLVFTGIAAAQQQLPPDEAKKPAAEVELPPEEDAAVKPEVFSFNPVKSKRDVEVGAYYLKKGDYKGALDRFVDATKWNDGNAEAWMHIGEAWEKLSDKKAAREAYEHYLKLAPTAKNAPEIRKRLSHLDSEPRP